MDTHRYSPTITVTFSFFNLKFAYEFLGVLNLDLVIWALQSDFALTARFMFCPDKVWEWGNALVWNRRKLVTMCATNTSSACWMLRLYCRFKMVKMIVELRRDLFWDVYIVHLYLEDLDCQGFISSAVFLR